MERYAQAIAPPFNADTARKIAEAQWLGGRSLD